MQEVDLEAHHPSSTKNTVSLFQEQGCGHGQLPSRLLL